MYPLSPRTLGLFLLAVFSGNACLPPLYAQTPASRVSSTRSNSAKIYDQQLDEIASAADVFHNQHLLLRKIVRVTKPIVVHIEAKKRTGGALRNETVNRKGTFIEEAGSGVVFAHQSRFYIITNYHVVENSSVNDIRVEADGKWFSPTRVIHDKQTDVSILFTDRDDLVAARMGDSDLAEIGDFVVAVGSPFGLSHSVSYGIISAKGRRDLELGPQGVTFQDFLQTDAAINPGNSGGPLINLKGEVIGINTAIASNSGGSDGIGFSIPSNMAVKIAKDLVEYGKVQRGFLGISLDARFSPTRAIALGLLRASGARVSHIAPESPAANSEIKIGDIVVEFDGVKIANDSHLVTLVSLTDIGRNVPVKVFRSGAVKELTMKVGKRD